MKKKLKVSIVVPIYNVEKHLNKCVDSILEQTYQNIEIILVDDGSPDNSGKICDEYVKQDTRIKVIHKKNAGLGYARNSGIEIATGDYIYFVDSDDYIEKTLIEECIKEIEKNKSEIVIFGMQRVDDQGNIISNKIPTAKKEKYIKQEVTEIILPNALGMSTLDKNNINIGPSAWSTMISLKIIKKLDWRFVSEREIISEDVYSILNLYNEVENVSIINKALYNYRINPSSLTQVYRQDRFEKNNIFYQKAIEQCEKIGYKYNVKQAVAIGYFNNIIGVMKSIVSSKLKYKDKISDIKTILYNPIYQEAIDYIESDKESFKRKLLIKLSKRKNVIMLYLLVFINLKVK